MKRGLPAVLILIVLLTSLITSNASAESTASSQIDFAKLDQVVTEQMTKHGLPGVALAVIEDDEVIYTRGYGKDGEGQALSSGSQMFIGSLSKSFTALSIAQLAEAGLLDINAPVQTYIPWFRIADEEASGRITLSHLLHHTSGLSDAGFSKILPLDISSEAAVRSLSDAQLTAPIGTQFQYFNQGYAVLAYIVELTSGQTYADYVQTHILDPLVMDSTTADPDKMAGVSLGFSRLFGFAVPMKQAVSVHDIGDGYIISTAEDIAKYAIAMMKNDTGRLLSSKWRKIIFTPGIGNYGMGWFVEDNGAKIFHGGANETFRTQLTLYPYRKRAFVLLTNEGYQIDHFISAGQLTSAVEAVVLGYTPAPTDQGWSVRWIGWIVGTAVLGLLVLHTRNFMALRGWRKRAEGYSKLKRVWDIALSFLIPVAITTVVISQIAVFYGNRFNLLTSVAYLRLGLPDIFILMLVGTLPDLVQGVIKIVLWCRPGKKA